MPNNDSIIGMAIDERATALIGLTRPASHCRFTA